MNPKEVFITEVEAAALKFVEAMGPVAPFPRSETDEFAERAWRAAWTALHTGGGSREFDPVYCPCGQPWPHLGHVRDYRAPTVPEMRAQHPDSLGPPLDLEDDH